jgi:hypothetical protein
MTPHFVADMPVYGREVGGGDDSEHYSYSRAQPSAGIKALNPPACKHAAYIIACPYPYRGGRR